MRLERGLVLLAAILYLLALGLPAVTGSGFPAMSGMDMLRQGAAGWRSGVFAWYANPVFALAALLVWVGYRRFALAAAGLSLALGLSSFGAAGMAERSGRSVPEFAFSAGFYLWLGALAVVAAAALLGIYKVSPRSRGRERGAA